MGVTAVSAVFRLCTLRTAETAVAHPMASDIFSVCLPFYWKAAVWPPTMPVQ